MDAPDRRLFEADIQSAEFRTGVITGRWGIPDEDVLPAGLGWPTRVLWIAAATRVASPDRFQVSLDLSGYRAAPPTGTFWDPTTKSLLEFAKRPQGREGSRFAKIFRTDWEKGRAFYHPYDRVATAGHSLAEALRLFHGGPAYTDLKLRLSVPGDLRAISPGRYSAHDAALPFARSA